MHERKQFIQKINITRKFGSSTKDIYVHLCKNNDQVNNNKKKLQIIIKDGDVRLSLHGEPVQLKSVIKNCCMPIHLLN
jgi:hypothetical protein